LKHFAISATGDSRIFLISNWHEQKKKIGSRIIFEFVFWTGANFEFVFWGLASRAKKYEFVFGREKKSEFVFGRKKKNEFIFEFVHANTKLGTIIFVTNFLGLPKLLAGSKKKSRKSQQAVVLFPYFRPRIFRMANLDLRSDRAHAPFFYNSQKKKKSHARNYLHFIFTQ